MLAIQYANESRSDKKKNNRKTSLQGSLRQATVEIIFMKFHRTNEILKRNKMQVLFCFWYRNQKKKEVCPAPLTLCRSGRRDVMMMMIIRTAGRVSHGVVTIPANDRIACAVKTKKTKWEQNAVHIICSGVDTFAGHTQKQTWRRGKNYNYTTALPLTRNENLKKNTTRRRWWFLWMTYFVVLPVDDSTV